MMDKNRIIITGNTLSYTSCPSCYYIIPADSVQCYNCGAVFACGMAF